MMHPIIRDEDVRIATEALHADRVTFELARDCDGLWNAMVTVGDHTVGICTTMLEYSAVYLADIATMIARSADAARIR